MVAKAKAAAVAEVTARAAARDREFPLMALMAEPPPPESCYPHGSPADCRVCVVMPFCSKIEAMTNALDSVLMQTHTNWELMLVLNNANLGNSCGMTVATTEE